MKNLFLLISILFFLSCQKENNLTGAYIEGSIDISLEDSLGNDLLKSSNEKSYKLDNIEVYYLVDNKVKPATELTHTMDDYPNGLLFYKKDNKSCVRIFVNLYDLNDSTTTYVKWNETDTDTISILFERENSYFILQQKIWFNNHLIWNRKENNTERYFNFIKY